MGYPPPPHFGKSLESWSWREIPRKIMMSKNLNTKFFKAKDLGRG